MKKLIMAVMPLLLLVTAAHAQETQKKNPVAQKAGKQKQDINECCIMKDGKMFHYKDGKEIAIAKETTFNGMKISPDGTCKMANGKSMKLKEGECCDAKGIIHKDCQKMMKRQ